MKRRVLTSVTASAVLLSGILFTGCFSSSNSGGSTSGGSSSGGSTSGGSTSGGSAMIQIQTGNGSRTSVDPVTGGTVVINRNNDGTQNVATVIHAELNECANATSDDDGDGVICGPKKNVTYVFQSDFGKLGGGPGHGDGQGDLDDDRNTYDGGILLYDALTFYNGVQYETPVEGNISENRIQEVYIPANYIKLTEAAKQKSVDEQYEMMRTYLADVCNMQCMVQEPDNNPYFRDGKTKGSFLATFVMWFTKGTGEDTLKQTFSSGDYSDLEYLTVEFQLDVEQVDGNSSKLRFTSPAKSDVVFGAKKADQGAITVTTKNDVINSILHESQNYVHPNFTINMAKYFDKLIAKGDSIGVSDYAKSILVENAQHPWPVKIYGTLHEIKDGSYERSFVRNPGKMDATLFNLDNTSLPYGSAYDAPHEDKTAVKAIKFNIVYPGANYNEL